MRKTTNKKTKTIKVISTPGGIPVSVGSRIRMLAGGDEATVVEVSEAGGVTIRWDGTEELEPFSSEEWATTKGRFALIEAPTEAASESTPEAAPEVATEVAPEVVTDDVMQCFCGDNPSEDVPEVNPEVNPEAVVEALEDGQSEAHIVTTASPAPAPAPEPEVHKTVGTRLLRCTLTEEEKEAYGLALAQFVTELEGLEAAQKDIPKQIKSVRERMRSTKNAMQNGYEDRDVEVYERDRGGPTIDIVRSDTDEVVDVREATKKDRQASLFDEDEDEGEGEE